MCEMQNPKDSWGQYKARGFCQAWNPKYIHVTYDSTFDKVLFLARISNKNLW